jgi:hypothetical protein
MSTEDNESSGVAWYGGLGLTEMWTSRYCTVSSHLNSESGFATEEDIHFSKTCSPSENEKMKEARQPDNPRCCYTLLHLTVSNSSLCLVTPQSAVTFPPLSPPHVPYRLRGLPSRLWPKCNWLLGLGRPWGAVTLSRWGGWWYMNMKYQEGP